MDRLFALEIEGRFTSFAKDVDTATCKTTADSVCTTQQFANEINNLKLGGADNWRMPTGNELFDIIDFGETATLDDGRVAGLSLDYFPNQTINVNNDYAEYGKGIIWTDHFFADGYGGQEPGSVYMNAIALNGTEAMNLNKPNERVSLSRGSSSQHQVYTGSYEDQSYNSYVFPIRLVAIKEGK